MLSNQIEKWENYHKKAIDSGESPPWESNEVFHGLKTWMEIDFSQHFYIDSSSSISSCRSDCLETPLLRYIELGSGSSSSAIWVAKALKNIAVYAIDISEAALYRASMLDNANIVKWIKADILSDDFFTSFWPAIYNNKSNNISHDTVFNSHELIEKNSFNIVFDMQCFHVLREYDESKAANVIYDLLAPNGYAMLVVGAYLNNEPLINGNNDRNINLVDKLTVEMKDQTALNEEAHIISKPGPPKLRKDQLIEPLIRTGLILEYVAASKFNATPAYIRDHTEVPDAWIAIFRKP